MKIRTIDSSGYDVEFEFADKRLAAFDRALRAMGMEGAGMKGARDGDPIFHSISQLAFLEHAALTKEYQKRIYEDALGECITSEAGPTAATVNYETVDHTGKGQRLSPSGDNMPMADVVTNLVSITVAEGGIGYSYTLHDLEAASLGILPLPASKQEAAVEGYKNHMDDALIQGEAGSNFKGLFNDSTVPTGARPSGTPWTGSTVADTLLSDLNAGLSTVYTNSKENHLVTTVALPPTTFQYMTTRIPNSDKTVLSFFMENNFTVQMNRALKDKFRVISGSPYLETAGTGASRMAAFYSADIGNIKAHVPMTIRFGAPQPHMNKLVVPSRYRYAGTNNRRVYASYFMYGL